MQKLDNRNLVVRHISAYALQYTNADKQCITIYSDYQNRTTILVLLK